MLKSLSIVAIALFGVLAGSMAAPAMAKEYVIVDYEDDMSMLRVLDRGSVAPVKDAIKSGWVITMFQGPAIEDNVVRRRALIMYDCATPRSAFRTIQLFEQADAAPADSWDYTDADLEWDEVKPDSVGGYTRDIVCGTQTVTDDDLITADDDVDLHHHFTSAYQSK